MAGKRRVRRGSSESRDIIVLDNVSKSYSTGAPALNGVSIRIRRGEFVFVGQRIRQVYADQAAPA